MSDVTPVLEPAVGALARIKIPAEAAIPIAVAGLALLVLVVFGSQLKAWKARAPVAAARFGLIAAMVLTATATYFLASCVTNQADPNNEGLGNLSFVDPAVGAALAGFAIVFWGFADQRVAALLVGLGIGVLVFVKPFAWPVIHTWDGYGFPRDWNDPEHLVFFGPGVGIVIVTMIFGLRARQA